MRAGKINISGGYDGEFGVVKIFSPEERDTLSGQPLLFQVPEKKSGEKDNRLPVDTPEDDTVERTGI